METSCHPMAAQGAASLDLLLVFLSGLTVSLGHCLAMCGPLQGLFCASRVKQRSGGVALAGSLVAYHAARITAYALIGGLFAVAGSTLRFTAHPERWQGGLALLAAAVLILFSLAMAVGRDSASMGSAAKRLTAPLLHALDRGLRTPGPGMSLRLGFLNGLLPCGPVFALALTVATASADVRVGMVLMAAYGLGTLPVLFSWGMLSARLGQVLRSKLVGVAWIFLLLAGMQLALRGLAVLGAVNHVALGNIVLW